MDFDLPSIILSGKRLVSKALISQHDNNHKHTNKTHSNTLLAIDLPSSEPDLNIIVAEWDHFQRGWSRRQQTSKEKL